jgi:hypothetical protein
MPVTKVKSQARSKSKKRSTKSTSSDDKKKKKRRTMKSSTQDLENPARKSSNTSTDDKKKKKRRTRELEGLKPSLDKKKKKRRTRELEGLKPSLDKKKKKRRSSSTDDKKKKKKRRSSSTDDKKKKKKKRMSGEIDGIQTPRDSMKEAICKTNRDIDFADIDVSDRTTYWGLGIEHEMQLFHKASSGMKNTNIMFNSQESTCFLTNERDSCCKTKVKCNDFTNESKKYKIKDFGLTDEEKLFIENTTWELSGRQVKNCDKGKEITWLSERVPILMPEIISTNFANRTIDSISKEIINLENHYVSIQMKNPHTKQKVAKYGPLTTHLCGSNSEILVPQEPTINSKEYVFKKHKMIDYLGSYHITITLPHTRDIDTKDFIKMHQNMAQQIQWLEPLMVTAFFSPTQSAVGNPENDEPEGSYRVMTIGWGNFGGSDVRKMGTTGLDRGSSFKTSQWRKTMNFKGTKKLNECVKKSPVQYRKAKSIHTGDFRTFGIEKDFEKCKKLYNPSDCETGRADGKPMAPPFGMEIRIFDHFPSEYLIELMRIVVLIGCNSQRHPATDYVNSDKRWITALRSIMRDGWNATIETKYITALRSNLGLPVNTSSMLAFDIFKQIVHELYEVNKDAYFNKIMNEHPEIEPVVPSINRMCWELAFANKFNIKIINFLKSNFHSNQIVSLSEFTNIFKASDPEDFTYLANDISDLLYALEKNDHVQLEIFNGKITNIKILQ